VQFRAVYRSLILKNCVSPSTNANCKTLESDKGYIAVQRKSSTLSDASEPGDISVVVETYVHCVSKNKFVDNCLYYITGFIIRSLSEVLSCEECVLALHEKILDSPDPSVSKPKVLVEKIMVACYFHLEVCSKLFPPLKPSFRRKLCVCQNYQTLQIWSFRFSAKYWISCRYLQLIKSITAKYCRGVYTMGEMVRDAPWRKFGGREFCDDNDAFARVYNNLLLHEYINYFYLLPFQSKLTFKRKLENFEPFSTQFELTGTCWCGHGGVIYVHAEAWHAVLFREKLSKCKITLKEYTVSRQSLRCVRNCCRKD